MLGGAGFLPSTVSQWIIISLKVPPYQDAGGHQDHDTFRDPELSLLLLIFTTVRSDVIVNLKMFNFNVHPGRLTWNLEMMVWKMIFVFNWMSFWFQPLIFQGVRRNNIHSRRRVNPKHKKVTFKQINVSNCIFPTNKKQRRSFVAVCSPVPYAPWDWNVYLHLPCNWANCR